MSAFVTFFVFLLIMLALAALGIILDWMGKPIRRSFRPRTAGTPAWFITDQPAASVTEPPKPSAKPDTGTSDVVATRPAVSGHWQPGQSIFKPTPKGNPPSIAAVRRRYWKNLSERSASTLFGENNQVLMANGQAPQRFNPRTGSLEELQLPEEMLRSCWVAKRRPTPTWGDQGLDPYARL